MGRRTLALRRAACAAVLVTSGIARVAAAAPPDPATDETAPARNGSRTLDGHTFLLPAGGASAFVTTHFGIAQGAYYLRVPDFPIDGFTVPFNVAVSGLSETASFGFGVTDWLGFMLNGKALAITGINDISLFTRGALLDFGGGVGAVLRVFKLKSTQLSVRASLDYAAGYEVDLKRLTQTIEMGKMIFASAPDMQQAALEFSRLLTEAPRTSFAPTTSLGYRLGLHGAQAAGRVFGFQLHGTFTLYRDTLEPYDVMLKQSEHLVFNRRVLELEGTAEADFASHRVPMALQAGYRLSFISKDEDSPEQPLKLPEGATHTMSAGIFYSGAHHFQLGLVGSTTLGLDGHTGLLTERVSGPPTLFVAALQVDYVW